MDLKTLEFVGERLAYANVFGEAEHTYLKIVRELVAEIRCSCDLPSDTDAELLVQAVSEKLRKETE